MKVPPADLKPGRFCGPCFNSKVQPALAAYNEVMKRAKDVIILDKPRRQALPILKTSKEPLQVAGCDDREETILRLAFLAAERGFNAVIKTNVDYKKIRNAGYQKMEWHGTGIPAVLDSGKFERQLDRDLGTT
jgi:hypothetical protein